MLRFEPLAVGHVEQLAQHALARLRGVGAAANSEVITAVGDFDVEPTLNVPKMLVELATEIGEPRVVFGLQDQVSADYRTSQSELSIPDTLSCAKGTLPAKR